MELGDLKNVPEYLKLVIPPTWKTFYSNCLKELEEAKELRLGEYKGPVHKNLYNGSAIYKSPSGEMFKGNFKDGKK